MGKYSEMTDEEISEIEGSEKFDTVYENALNGIDPDSLADEEAETHRRWVIENWDDFAGGE